MVYVDVVILDIVGEDHLQGVPVPRQPESVAIMIINGLVNKRVGGSIKFLSSQMIEEVKKVHPY